MKSLLLTLTTMDYKKCDELQLYIWLFLGDKDAFLEIFDRYSNELFRRILPDVSDERVAEQVLEDVFASLWKQREEHEVEVSLLEYIYSKAKHHVVDHAKHEMNPVNDKSAKIYMEVAMPYLRKRLADLR